MYTKKGDLYDSYFYLQPFFTSQYWNNIHGSGPGEAEADGEGKQTMRVLAGNMSFLMKSIALGNEKYGLPKTEGRIYTNFIH